MKYLNRYIATHIITATAIVLAVLAGIETFMLFFSEVGDIGRASYTIDKVLLFVMMQLPFQLYQLFPMAGFLGCLIGLGRLSASSELVVMQTNGVSVFGVLTSAIKAALLMIFVVTLLGEGVAPSLQSYSTHMKAAALGKAKDYASLGGVWLRNNNKFIHIGHVAAANRVEEVSTFTMNNHQLQQVNFALTAEKVDKVWQMENVQQTDFSPQEVATQLLDVSALDTEFDPVLLFLGQISIDQLSVRGLHQSIHSRRQAKLDTAQYQFVFWQRIFQPLITVIMICLGVPFIFSAPRSQSMGLRILIGIIIGFAFYTLNQFLGPLAVVYQLSPVIAAAIPVVIFLMACGILFRRV